MDVREWNTNSWSNKRINLSALNIEDGPHPAEPEIPVNRGPKNKNDWIYEMKLKKNFNRLSQF